MKQVGIAEFKAHLSQYLRQAREGGIVEITDRGTPVARLAPADRNGFRIPPGKGSLCGIPSPPPNTADYDVVEDLLRDRERR